MKIRFQIMTRAYSYLRYGACGWRWLCHVQAGSLLEREALRLRTGRHLYFRKASAPGFILEWA